MIGRCTNPLNKDFADYGGRGISVCPAWRSDFTAFLEHVGRRPSRDHSIDRYPDGDGNYEPGNVRWATASQQNRNRRGMSSVEYLGKMRTVAEISELSGLTTHTIFGRLRKGWPAELAVSVPMRKFMSGEKVAEIKRSLARGVQVPELAKTFGLSDTQVYRIRDGISRKTARVFGRS